MTGASGCVGHYLLEILLETTPHELFLLVRDPARLRMPVLDHPRVHILQGNLSQIEQHAEVLGQMDVAILAAAAWGGTQDVMHINVDCNLKLMELLDPQRCQRVVYFSTASILDRQNRPLEEAGDIGTDYIRSKYECHQRLPQLAVYPKIATVFPTLVFGGEADKPYSFISEGLGDIIKWMGLIRFFRADGSFHFIHARDIARVVVHLALQSDADGYREYVLGNPALTVNQVVEQACDYLGKRIWFRIPLSMALADLIIRVFRIEMAPWDYFCVKYRHFVYKDVMNPAQLGEQPYCATLKDLFRVHGIAPR